MTRAEVPPDATVLTELGSARPTHVSYDPARTLQICWVVTNGRARWKLFWVTRRKSGVYLSLPFGPGIHYSYHSDGTFHTRPAPNEPQTPLGKGLALDQFRGIRSLGYGGMNITTKSISRRLPPLGRKPVGRLIVLDNRVLSNWLHTYVWLIEPFRLGLLPLMVDMPLHLHVLTHVTPWLAIAIYEDRQGMSGRAPR